jgi:hypothetical protein
MVSAEQRIAAVGPVTATAAAISDGRAFRKRKAVRRVAGSGAATTHR